MDSLVWWSRPFRRLLLLESRPSVCLGQKWTVPKRCNIGQWRVWTSDRNVWGRFRLWYIFDTPSNLGGLNCHWNCGQTVADRADICMRAIVNWFVVQHWCSRNRIINRRGQQGQQWLVLILEITRFPFVKVSFLPSRSFVKVLALSWSWKANRQIAKNLKKERDGVVILRPFNS